MQTLHRFASAFLAVALVACAAPSSSTPDDDADSQSAEVTVNTISVVGRAKQELRADLRAALGKAPSETEEATVAGVLSVRQDVFSDQLVFQGSTWDLDLSANNDGTLDFVFPSGFDGPEVRTDGQARKLFDAMTTFTTKRTLTIVGSNTTRTSPGGLVACTVVTSVQVSGDRYRCNLKGVEGISRTRAPL